MIGNPSADMDSMICSLGMSWFYGFGKDILYSPVVNCYRSELKLRIEIMEHLS